MANHLEAEQQLAQLKRLSGSTGHLNALGFLDAHLTFITERVNNEMPTFIQVAGWPESGKSFFVAALIRYLARQFPEVADDNKLVVRTFEQGFKQVRDSGAVITGIEEERRDIETEMASGNYGRLIYEEMISGSLLIVGEAVVNSGAKIGDRFEGLNIGTMPTYQIAKKMGIFEELDYGFLLIEAMGGRYLRRVTSNYRSDMKATETLDQGQAVVKRNWFLGIDYPATEAEWQMLKLAGASVSQILNILNRASEVLDELPAVENLTLSTPYSYAKELSLFRHINDSLTLDNPHFSKDKIFIGLDNPKRRVLTRWALARGFTP